MVETTVNSAPRKSDRISARAKAVAEMSRQRLRLLLMAGVPLVAVAAGAALYISGGRYISTDNAYVGAQKVLITPDISGKVSRILVREGQRVAAGDELFNIDPAPFKFALQQAQSRLDTVRTDFANLKSNYKSLSRLIDIGAQTVEIKRRLFDRKNALAAHKFSTQVDIDNANAALLTAELQLQPMRQQLAETLNQLQGDSNLAIENFPPTAKPRRRSTRLSAISTTR